MRPVRRPGIFHTIVLGLCVCLSAPAAAQQTEEDREPTFFETIDVQIVNVDVIVTDKDGNPVRGLSQEDFRILEDGKPVDITNFFAMQGGRPADELEAAPGGVMEGREGLERPADQTLHLLIFIDHFNLSAANRSQMLAEVSDFIEREMALTDRVMVVSYDGELEVEQGPTSDAGTVQAAIDHARKQSALSARAQLEQRTLLREISDPPLNSGGPGGGGFGNLSLSNTEEVARSTLSSVRAYTEARTSEARRTVQHVKDFTDSLAALEGRKAILFVSEGISLAPGQAMLQAWENKFEPALAAEGKGLPSGYNPGAIVDTRMGALVTEMAEYASSNRVTFYSIGAGGGGLSASSADMGFASGDLNTRGGGRIWHAGLESIQANNLYGSLQMMAETTGGVVANSPGAARRTMSTLHADLLDYYSLAYMPERRRDGKLHNIEVKVTREGMKVRHRNGYRAKTVDQEMNDRTKSALLLGEETNPLGVEIDFGREAQHDKGRYMVPVMVKIPLGRIVLLPQEKFHEGKLSIFLGARDDKGRSAPVQKTEVPIRIPNEQVMAALSQVGGYGLNVVMRSGRHRVAVTVRDELGNTQSSISADFTPGRLVVDTEPRRATGSR